MELSVLIIDDDAGVRFVLSKIIKKYGYAVFEASSAEDALAMLGWGIQPCGVVCDVHLGGASGKDFLKRLKERGLLSSFPVLMLTGFEELELTRSLIDLGAKDCLSKALSPNAVVARLLELIDAP